MPRRIVKNDAGICVRRTRIFFVVPTGRSGGGQPGSPVLKVMRGNLLALLKPFCDLGLLCPRHCQGILQIGRC